MVSPDVLAAVWQSFSDPGQIVQILSHPISAQPPDLVHFQPPLSGNRGNAVAQHASQPLLALGLPGLLAILLLGLLGGAAMLLGGRWRLPANKGKLLLAILPLALVILLAGRALGVHAGPLSAFAPAGQRPVNALPPSTLASAQPDGHAFLAGHDLVWMRLLDVEGSLNTERAQLVQSEATIRRCVLEGLQDDGAGLHPASVRNIQRTSGLATQDLQMQQSYDANLQAEYAIYQQAAQNPALRATLVAHAGAMGAEVKRIVLSNLSLVELQMQQEALINASLAHASVPSGLLTAPGATMFLAPISGTVVQPFGATNFALEAPMEYRGVFYPHFHTGIDIAAPEGTAIRSAANGVVALVGRMVDRRGHLVGYGNFVTIIHPDGYLTLYAHMQSVAVTVGQVVKQGDLIGSVGSTGFSTGPHLHFEIRHERVVVDPLPFLTGGSPPAKG